MRGVFNRIFIRSFAVRSVTLAGLLVFAVAVAGAGPAHGDCRNQHAQPGTSQSGPYPALKQAVDTYFAQRQEVEGFSGVSLRRKVRTMMSPAAAPHSLTGSRSVRTRCFRSAALPRASRAC
jgi:hypothetical protein